MFANQFFYVLHVKLPNAFQYEKQIIQHKGILVADPVNCIVITSLVSPKRLLRHVDKNCKCISNVFLDRLKDNPSEKMSDHVVYEKEIEFSDELIVFQDFPDVKDEKKAIISLLEILQNEREFNGETFNSLAYRKAMSGIRASPKSLREIVDTGYKEVAFIGPKIAAIVEEFVETGSIKEADNIAMSERYKVMMKLTNIWGVGDKTAMEWFNKGYKSIEDVIENKEPLNKNIQLGMKYNNGLSERIPRVEVDEIVDFITKLCRWKEQNVLVTIVGSHRRGKATSGDIDVVISHDNDEFCESLLDNSLNILQSYNVLEDIYQKSTRMKYRYEVNHGDSDDLDKALTVIKYKDKYRQLDLICCTKEQLPFCLLGWTGSATFERLIKQHTKNQGYTLSSTSIYKKVNKEKIQCSSEAHIFHFIGLPYRAPEMRNA